jgi:predicted DNA-binding antitoxin AbrB/MazE fold protein
MQAYRAYYDGGRFVPLEAVEIPEGSQAIITVLDDALGSAFGERAHNVHAEAWREFLEEIGNIDNEPVSKRWTTEITARNKMFLIKLGVALPC